MTDVEHAVDLTAFQVSAVSMAIRPAPLERPWMTDSDGRFAYRCLPLLLANQSGWVILNNDAFSAWWTGGSAVNATIIQPRNGRSVPVVASHFGQGIITWSLPYLFRTSPGFSLLVRGPANSPKDGVSPLEGLVESDWASATFTMNWQITRPDTEITFEVDEPICMIVPQRRADLDAVRPTIRPIEDDPDLARRYQEWNRGRSAFNRALRDRPNARSSAVGSGPGEPEIPDAAIKKGWQGHYFLGRHASGERGSSDHRTKVSLAEFEAGS